MDFFFQGTTLIYTIVALVGLTLLLLSLFVDFLDFMDLFDGLVSGAGLGAGAMFFGGAGILITPSGLPDFAVALLSLLVGVLALLAISKVTVSLSQSRDELPDSSLYRRGTVHSPVDATNGQVALDGESSLRAAWSETPLPEGTYIYVVLEQGSRVKVARVNPEG